MNRLAPLPQHRRAIARWLAFCLTLITCMVIVGGVTRLTESGLSIVEWKLFSGTLPPLSEPAWQAEFEEYKATPQFQKVNAHFELGDFKRIYWLEYVHRLLGRVIGLAVLLPFIYFAARKQLPRPLFWRCMGIGLLVAAQGTVGWVMVASGLIDQPRVAPIKLGLHLLLAFTVFCVIQWTRWQVQDKPRGESTRNPFAWAVRAVFALIVLQIYLGALVAGLRAGLSYNTYPLMDGQFIPDGLHLLTPWWLNHLEGILTVQFQHRMGAIALVAAFVALMLKGWKYKPLRHTLRIVGITVLLQFALGVVTLLSGVNIWLAVAHQLLALGVMSHFLQLLYLCPLDANQHPARNHP
jgi:cytochrome c oxidase assembly protein subunit 15